MGGKGLRVRHCRNNIADIEKREMLKREEKRWITHSTVVNRGRLGIKGEPSVGV